MNHLEKGLRLLQTPLTRKSFLKLCGLGMAALALPMGKARSAFAKSAGERLQPRPGRKSTTLCDLAVAKGSDPGQATRKAIEALGGIDLFVRPGDVVVVKPNIGWDRSPAQAGCTNPEVVAAIVTLCRAAGAKTVKVFDNTCNTSQRCYANSGILDAAQKAGAQVYYANNTHFQPGAFPMGAMMDDWPIHRDAARCDCFINVPVAKHHGYTGLTLSIKNLMGVCGGMRGMMHQHIDQKLAELCAFIKPDLNVIDGWNVLLRHGPQGGNLSDVAHKGVVAASKDPVLADTWACSLFGVSPSQITHIAAAAQMGLGNDDLLKASVRNL